MFQVKVRCINKGNEATFKHYSAYLYIVHTCFKLRVKSQLSKNQKNKMMENVCFLAKCLTISLSSTSFSGSRLNLPSPFFLDMSLTISRSSLSASFLKYFLVNDSVILASLNNCNFSSIISGAQPLLCRKFVIISFSSSLSFGGL
jgi:hypothetical protein